MMRASVFLITLFLIFTGNAFSAPGQLDATFGTSGVAIFDSAPTGADDYASKIIGQPDGKVLVLGSSRTGLPRAYKATEILRYNTDGSPDASFGINGAVVNASDPPDIGDFAVQQDGKIVATGRSSLCNGPVVLRFSSDGAVDATFGNSGAVCVNQTPSGSGHRILAQQDGKLVVIGEGLYDNKYVMWICRLTPAGYFDETFGQRGMLYVGDTYSGYGSSVDPYSPAALQADGKLIIALRKGVLGPLGEGLSDLAVLRYNQDGTPDTSFGVNGESSTDLGRNELARAIAIQGDGKILLMDHADLATYVLRINPDGNLDSSFANNGFLLTQLSSYSSGNLASQADGRIIITGSTDLEVAGFAPNIIQRYTADGNPDPTFGTNGTSGYEDNEHRVALNQGLVLTGDGKYVVAGQRFNGRETDILLTRFGNTGITDTSFGDQGFALYASQVGPPNNGWNKTVLQEDGKIVALGSTFNGINYDILVARYNADGSLDNSFGSAGFMRYNGSRNADDDVGDLAIQPDGKIVVTGITDAVTSLNLIVLRINADGSLDNSFGTGGAVVSTGMVREGASILVQPDGKILVAGAELPNSWFGKVWRFNGDGSLDASFGGENGVSVENSKFYGMALQPDGKIVATGAGYTVRLNLDGSLDTTFGVGGLTYFGQNFDGSYGASVALQPDGKIVIGGMASLDRYSNGALLVRLNANGFIDGTFGKDGFVLLGPTQEDLRVYCFNVLLQPNGAVLMTGFSETQGAIVARYSQAGQIDTTFGTNGIFRYTGSLNRGGANGAALQPDGKIVVAGNVVIPDGSRGLLMRLTGGTAPVDARLTVAKSASGTVVSSPSGITCGSMCSATFTGDSEVDLTATPARGYSFLYWSGGCTGLPNPCRLTMHADTTVSAVFAKSVTLTVSKRRVNGGDGTVTSDLGAINCGGTCRWQYSPEATVVLSAMPGPLSTFTGWSPASICAGTDTCKVTTGRAKSVSATFVGPYVLKVAKASKKGGSGRITSSPQGIDCGADCRESYALSTVVTLNAEPDPNSSFSGWSPKSICSGTGSCEVTMNAARTVRATFTGGNSAAVDQEQDDSTDQ